MKNISYTKWDDAQKIIESNKPIYLLFSADWCGDCQMNYPIYETLSNQYKNKDIQFIMVDADESKLFREETKWKVYKIPTHIFIKNAEIKNILYEYQGEDVLIDNIENILN